MREAIPPLLRTSPWRLAQVYISEKSKYSLRPPFHKAFFLSFPKCFPLCTPNHAPTQSQWSKFLNSIASRIPFTHPLFSIFHSYLPFAAVHHSLLHSSDMLALFIWLVQKRIPFRDKIVMEHLISRLSRFTCYLCNSLSVHKFVSRFSVCKYVVSLSLKR
jgi:hypothetical protein